MSDFPKKRTGKSRLMASSKLSAYQLSKIVEAYAFERSAAMTARSMKVSYQSVRAIYAALRRRLVELGVYPTLESYVRAYRDENDRDLSSWHIDDLAEPLARRLGKRKLDISSADEDQISEMLFRMEPPPELTHRQFCTQHHQDILQLLKLSGPLNRPLTEDEWARAFDYRIERLFERGAESFRRVMLAAQRDIANRKR